MHVAPHMYKTITLNANDKEIITLKCIWHQICTKPLLWRQMQGNRHLKMCLRPTMYKIVTLKANAMEIITLKCFEGKC